MIRPVYIVDIIGEAVAGTTAEILPTLITNEQAVAEDGVSLIRTIDYQYGHRMELIQTLAQMDKSDEMARESKYPLVYLVQDFIETRGKIPGVYAEVSLNIIIAHQTSNTYKITDRMAKVFKPVLYPIYYTLLDKLADHVQINEYSEDIIIHQKIDRSYWGTSTVGGNEANALNDYVDAIEINNLSLKILYKNC